MFESIIGYATKKGFRYLYQFEIAPIDGKRKWYKKKGFETKSEAKMAGNKAFNIYYNISGCLQSKPNISYSDFLDTWIQKGVIG